MYPLFKANLYISIGKGATSNKLIKIKELSKAYGENIILDDVNMKLEKGESMSIIGFSGSGKSTLLKIIAGLIEADSGDIELGSTKLGMAFQYSALFDSMTVADNISFPLRVGDNLPELSDEEINQKVSERLSLVGLPGIEDLYPSELSGGMKKRVSFARAIINDPDILLYDEPTAGLDPVASTIIEDLIVKLQDETNAASIIVTHQPSTIKRTATCVGLLYDGNFVWQGCPKELFNDNYSDPYAKQFREGAVEGPMLIKH